MQIHVVVHSYEWLSDRLYGDNNNVHTCMDKSSVRKRAGETTLTLTSEWANAIPRKFFCFYSHHHHHHLPLWCRTQGKRDWWWLSGEKILIHCPFCFPSLHNVHLLSSHCITFFLYLPDVNHPLQSKCTNSITLCTIYSGYVWTKSTNSHPHYYTCTKLLLAAPDDDYDDDDDHQLQK